MSQTQVLDYTFEGLVNQGTYKTSSWPFSNEVARMKVLAPSYYTAVKFSPSFAMAYAGKQLLERYAGLARSYSGGLLPDEVEALKKDPLGEVYQCIFIEHLIFWPPDSVWPVHMPKAQLTNEVVGLAQEVKEKKDFRLLPIFADALHDAGCGYEKSVSHCREVDEATHTRFGCCALVELVLVSYLAFNQVKKETKDDQLPGAKPDTSWVHSKPV